MIVKSDELHSHYDIVVAGGGMVGGSFALLLMQLLQDTPLRVLVLDAMPVDIATSQQRHFDARSTALSWGSRLIYERMGLWPELHPHATPITDIHVSDHGRFGATRLHSHELDVEALGYVLENHDLSRLINAALVAQPRLEVCAPARLERATHCADGMQLTVVFDHPAPAAGDSSDEVHPAPSVTLQTSL